MTRIPYTLGMRFHDESHSIFHIVHVICIEDPNRMSYSVEYANGFRATGQGLNVPLSAVEIQQTHEYKNGYTTTSNTEKIKYTVQQMDNLIRLGKLVRI